MWLQTESEMIQSHLHNNMQEQWSHQQAASYTQKADKNVKIKKPDTRSRPAGSLAEKLKLVTNEKIIQSVDRVGFKLMTAGLWLGWPEL